MKDNRQIIGISLVLGMIAGTFFGIVFGDEGGKGIGIGIGLGMTLGIVIGAIIVNFKANGSEQADEDEFAMTDEEIKQGEYLADTGGEILTDEEEKQVWEEFQGKVEEDDN